MSQTFTLPIAAGDQFSHGHERRQSKHRRLSRIAPPFQLPRIPSGIVPSIDPVQPAPQHDHLHHSHTHTVSSASSSGSLNLPASDLNGPLVAGKRSFDLLSAHQTLVTMASAHKHVHRNGSRPTRILLNATENYSLLHGILADHDSRRIFYFMLLNLAFMGVQSTYGFLTGSLGLISDSIHMFFDCVALFVGVCAAVMSKWPPSAKFPHGYGKIDTLAGLGNGIFLMLISVEIIYEAVERLFTGSDLSRTTELLVVSLAGLAVNLVGIFAFHGHHGHAHGHGHGHSHGHEHSHADSHDHHSHSKKPSNAASASPIKSASPTHSHGAHSHHGENMQGIYLHIMADALGSVAVVASTVLVQLTGWSGFDPLASCIIAVLIFISTVPLVSSTIKILLLTLNDDVEYNLRDILGGVSEIRGVISYTVPKFWLEDIKKEDTHDHAHAHGDSHDHDHEHKHSHSATHHHHKSGVASTDSSLNGHDHHEHSREPLNQHSCSSETEPQVLGVIHIQISSSVPLADVQSRVSQYFKSRKMNVVVQYEREGENRCWCAGKHSTTPAMTSGVQKKPSRSSLAYELVKTL